MCFRPTSSAGPKTCPNCGQLNPPSATQCIICHTELPDAVYKCPRCGADNDSAALECCECGMEFGIDDVEDTSYIPKKPSGPGAPAAPGAPKAPSAPGAPKAPGAPAPK